MLNNNNNEGESNNSNNSNVHIADHSNYSINNDLNQRESNNINMNINKYCASVLLLSRSDNSNHSLINLSTDAGQSHYCD